MADQFHLFGKPSAKLFLTPQPSTVEKQPAQPRPWPIWSKAVKLLATPEDAGIGDTIHRLAGVAGTTFEAMFLRFFKRPCGCEVRRDLFNGRFPYK